MTGTLPPIEVIRSVSLTLIIVVSAGIAGLYVSTSPAEAASGTVTLSTDRGNDLEVAAGETLTVTVEYTNGFLGQKMKVIDDDGYLGDDVIASKTVESTSGTMTFEISRSELQNAKDEWNDDLKIRVAHGPYSIFGSSDTFDVTIGPSTVLYVKDVPSEAAKGEEVTVTAYGYSTESSLDLTIRDKDGALYGWSHDKYTSDTVYPDFSSKYFEKEFTITPSEGQDFGEGEVEIQAKADGETSSTSSVNIVKNQPPSIDSVSASPNPAEEDQVISFSGSVSDPEGDDMSISVEKTGGPDVSALSASIENGEITGGFIAPEVSPGSSKTVDLEFTLSDGSSETTKTVSVDIDNAQASIVDTKAPSGSYQEGDEVKTEVKVKNTGERTRTFYVGYGVQAESESQWRENDGTTHTDVILSPGDSKWVSLSWTVESDAPADQYDVRASVWEEGSTSKGADLSQRLDNWKKDDAFSVNLPPSADAGGPYSVKEGGSVSLDASGSSDPGGTIQSTSWTVTNGPGSVSSGTYQAPDQLSSDTEATVKVTVTDNGGLSDSATATVSISEVNDKPSASIKGPSSVNEGESVSFSSSSSDPENEMANTNWQVTNGPGSMSGNTYTAPDNLASDATATVKLTVTDQDGASDSATTQLQIVEQNQGPTASTSGPYSVREGGSVSLTSTSTDPENELASTEWSLVSGPGSVSGNTYQAPNNLASDATATVKLTVTDEDGATDSTTTQITIDEQNDDPSAKANGDYTVTEGGSVNLDASGSNDVDGNIQSTTWTVTNGPGSVSSGQYQAPDSISQQQTATVRVTVADNDGATATDTASVTIQPGDNTQPVATANGDYHVAEGGSVSLSSSGSNDPDGSIQSTSWSVTSGPGSVSDGVYQAPENELSDDATATVQLTVTDNEGATGTDTATVHIDEQNDKPTASANGPYSVTAGNTVALDASGSDDPDGSITTSWSVTDGPGSIVDGTYEAPSSVDSTTTATVKLTVTDDDGATATATASVEVNPTSDGSTPEISGFEATNPSGYTISVSVATTDSISDIAVDVTEDGSPVTTLTDDDFTRSDGAYTATFNPGSQGKYALTLETAANDHGNGASGERTTVTVDPPSEYNIQIETPTGTSPVQVEPETRSTITIETLLTAKTDLTASELQALASRLSGSDPPLEVTVGDAPATVESVEFGAVPQSIGAGDTIPMTITATTPARSAGIYDLTVTVESPPDLAIASESDTNPDAVDVTAQSTPSITEFSMSNPSGQTLAIEFESNERLDTIDVQVRNETGDKVTRHTEDFFEETQTSDGWRYTSEAAVSEGGTYTATLNTAANGSQDGASGQTATATIGETTTPTISVEDARVSVKESTTVPVTLSEAPNGLSGYEITIKLSDSSVGKITDVTLPDSYDLQSTTIGENNQSATIKAADTDNVTTPGDTGITLATVEVTGEMRGSTTVDVSITSVDTERGERIEPAVTPGSVQVTSMPCVGGGSSCSPPRDTDGDGGYEDVNGNGRVDFNDVVTLFQHMNDEAVQQNKAAFDFNGNGRVDFADIVELFEEV